jgi:hypothetical protein
MYYFDVANMLTSARCQHRWRGDASSSTTQHIAAVATAMSIAIAAE